MKKDELRKIIREETKRAITEAMTSLKKKKVWVWIDGTVTEDY